VRNRCGNNNNPSLLQFIAAFQKLLIHIQISKSKYANCLAQDNTSFLLLSAKSTSGIDDISIQNYNINSCTDNSNIHKDHDYYLHAVFDNLNKNYIDDIVAYIAAFIVFKIANVIISCDIRKQQIIRQCHSKLQILKNRSALINASADVVTLCKIAEKTFRENMSIISERNILYTLLVKTVRKVPSNIFSDTSHLFDRSCLNDHRLQLIKIIINKYFKPRCTHYGISKNANVERIRDKFTKLILFKSQ